MQNRTNQKFNYISKLIEIFLFLITIFVLFSRIISGYDSKVDKYDLNIEIKNKLQIIEYRLNEMSLRLDRIEKRIYK